ncbi:hypothetical protein BFP97_06730 [Roseivirga sp. 4D4]|uniref:hypothetical protein n=1 Tax=Roseivirga sp. 4D4 TaxID=1889784 RepID=UPI0008536882|nr:hypothetical protein [Roseivirga sp. 4D4]OEK01222.1 hypothetical protein BFP97_06730 [Roseivirga sp. 4D4]
MRCIIAFLLLTTTTVYSQQLLPSFDSELIESVYIDDNLRNAPKEYFIKIYEYNKDSARLIKSPIIPYYLLENGQVKEVQFREKNEVLKSHFFDSHGRIVVQRRFGFQENMPKITYEYHDDSFEAIETIYRLGDRVHSKSVIKYNTQLQVVAKEEYRGKDKLNRFWKYHYNEHNDLIADEFYDAYNGIDKPTDSLKVEYRYDDFQRKISRHDYRTNHLESRTDYAYFPDSAVKQTTFFSFDGVPKERHLEVKQDSLRVMVRGFFQNGDTVNFRSRFKEIYLYGDLVEYESRTIRGTYVDRFTTFYEYDEMGNWIKKTTYSNGVVIKKEERTILY